MPDERVEPASITKVMTVYVVFDAMREKRAELDTEVPISEKAWRGQDPPSRACSSRWARPPSSETCCAA